MSATVSLRSLVSLLGAIFKPSTNVLRVEGERVLTLLRGWPLPAVAGPHQSSSLKEPSRVDPVVQKATLTNAGFYSAEAPWDNVQTSGQLEILKPDFRLHNRFYDSLSKQCLAAITTWRLGA